MSKVSILIFCRFQRRTSRVWLEPWGPMRAQDSEIGHEPLWVPARLSFSKVPRAFWGLLLGGGGGREWKVCMCVFEKKKKERASWVALLALSHFHSTDCTNTYPSASCPRAHPFLQGPSASDCSVRLFSFLPLWLIPPPPFLQTSFHHDNKAYWGMGWVFFFPSSPPRWFLIHCK